MKCILLVTGCLWVVSAVEAQDSSSAPIEPVAPEAELGVAPASAIEAAATQTTDATPAEPQLDPAPPMPIASQPDPSEPMTAAELDALGIDTTQSGVDTALNFSGFADFTAAAQFGPATSLWRSTASVPRHSSFYVGNFNLYIRKNLTETLRTLGEVRFSYLPNGSYDPIERTQIRAQADDYNDFGRSVRWSGIEIQRLYLEWTAHPLVNIRAGQYLTPYGIWNVDHGTPTYIPVQRPFVVGLDWFPQRQTGFEVFGRWDVSTYATVGYNFTLSNGTGPVSEYADLDENKAVGGRVFLEYRVLGALRLGVSTYYGQDTSTTAGFFIAPSGEVQASESIDAQHDSLAWAADISWRYGGWQLQSEWISYQRAYTRQGRTRVNVMGTLQTPPDSISWGMYGLAGYRFEWFGVMPFVVVEHIDAQLESSSMSNITLQGGINARPIESLTLKLAWYHVKFFEGSVFGETALNMIQAQAAWTF